MPKLTILIPTRNRPEKVAQQAKNVLEKFRNYEELVQILISDNSDVPIDRSNYDERINFLRPSRRFPTFEEHFFWAIRKVDSEFLWTLGDDDEPQQDAIHELMRLISSNDYEIFMFNGLKEENMGKQKSLIPCSDNQIEMPYRQFLTMAGIWGVGAGISLCIFRTTLLKKSLLSEVEEINSPIYSHVVLFLRSFSNSRFVFVNRPLVLYKRSDPESQLRRSNNWENYAIISRRFYRYPWTIGFLKQISFLVESKCFSFYELSQTLEFDSSGHRYFLVDSLEMMLLEEIDNMFFTSSKTKYSLTRADLRVLVSKGMGGDVLNPILIDFLKKIDLSAAKQTKSVIKQFRSIQATQHGRLNNYELRFSQKNYAEFSEFMTPHGTIRINEKYNNFYNYILNEIFSKIGTTHLSKLPILYSESDRQTVLFRIFNQFRVLMWLVQKSSTRQYLKERIYIYARKLYLIHLHRKTTIISGKVMVKAKFWHLLSPVWMRIPFKMRRQLKKILFR